jgi:hypothetical protein
MHHRRQHAHSASCASRCSQLARVCATQPILEPLQDALSANARLVATLATCAELAAAVVTNRAFAQVCVRVYV